MASRAHLAALVAAIRRRTDLAPQVGIVLGSGLGGLAERVEDPVVIPTSELQAASADVAGPGSWPAASAPGHAGRLILGRLSGCPVVCLQGRFHVYEGHPPAVVVQPVLLMGELGAGVIVLTNAAGGIEPSFGPGTLMAIRDHINLTGLNPLIGPNDDSVGPRFPDLVDAWSPRLRRLLQQAAETSGVALAEGVYAGLLGPNYETPAEVRMLRTLGADAVGMSTVLEAIAARWAGLEVCGISLITNHAAGITDEPIAHEDVLRIGAEAGGRLAPVLERFVGSLAEGAVA